MNLPTKTAIDELALFGGAPSFVPEISTSNLVRPDIERFLGYGRELYAGVPLVERLESRLAAYHGTKHAVAMANGFWALALAIRALALPGRSEVVMPSLTYRRLADIVAWVGLVPHYCEVEPETLAISAATARPCINERTALLLGVHPIVNCCDVEGLVALARETGLPLMFDGVESMHETVRGRRIGSWGRAEVFSMHASKLVNGFEGGYVTTDDDALAARLAAARDRGVDDERAPAELGVSSRLQGLHAAMTLAGLDELDAQVLRNRERYRVYQAELARLPGIRLLAFDETEQTSFKTIVVELLDDWPLTRDRTVQALNREGVLARAYYAPPLHRKTTSYATVPVELPLTDRLAQRYLLLPCGDRVDADAIRGTVALLRLLRERGAEIAARWPQ
ncbi:MAG: aminotransferase class I/II-fold pyridoxal phosphate-dependent enzyme [Burkholderiales bacterium]|nr:aminotransferase class I/II-fold pyridoxal phosphate-dependent enzyme [Burkholderiales bacterium]